MPGFTKETSGKYVDFIIGISDDGDEITHTCDPSRLTNTSGSAPNIPHYLTPVCFRKSVLDKYYNEPGKYTVEDGYIRGPGWGLQIDNHHSGEVFVFLGDLGTYLSHKQQGYWKYFNIPPGKPVSDVHIRRQLYSEFVNSKEPEHIFSELYEKLHKICDETLGWQLLSPLNQGDAYHPKTTHIPQSEEQKHFDELILSLAKILVEGLNREKLKEFIPAGENVCKNDGSIHLLKRALKNLQLENYEITNYEKHIQFLLDLYELRSSGVAHNKGERYEKIVRKLGIDTNSLADASRQCLVKVNAFLGFLINLVSKGVLSEAGPSNGSPEEEKGLGKER